MNLVGAIYDKRSQVEESVEELQMSGIDMEKMSIVGWDYHTDGHEIGHREHSAD
jgi:hypothetical protein